MTIYKDILSYVTLLESRPPNFTRDSGGGGDWEYKAYSSVRDMSASLGIWDFAEPIYLTAVNLMGMDGSRELDYAHTQDMSMQFYALYADLLQEAMKGME